MTAISPPGRSFVWILTTAVMVPAIGASTFLTSTPRLLWNATASAPVGLYRLRPAERLAIGDLVAVRPPEPIARALAEGGYLPSGVPLLKRVVALTATTVCRVGDTVTVEGILVAEARTRDHLGRALPVWSGCRRLGTGEVFLLNPHPDSLDSRYFGPFPTASVLSRAAPLWLIGAPPDRSPNP